MKELLSKNIKTLRKKSGKSQSDIGLQLNKAHTSIGNWEKGISEPSLSEIEQIARIFEIKPFDLLFTDLSNGKLNGNLEVDINDQKGKVNGKGNGKVIGENERKTPKSLGEISPFLVPKNMGLPHVVVTDESGNENIVHVPIKARAGYLLGYGDTQYISGLNTYKLPGLRHGTFRSFEVEGSSMKPTLLNRDWVVGEWVESLADIRENRVHIIVTKNNGILIKRVLNRISDRNKLYLKSDNFTQRGDYPTIDLNPEEVLEIWYARVKFSPDFSEPSEIYRTVDDLKIDVMELKKQLATIIGT